MKFLDLLGLETFLDNLKEFFSPMGHKHTTADITDYTVDSAFSATSTNPIQNKAVNEALVAFAGDVEKVETDILAHVEDVENPHEILEKIKANSDLVNTEESDEIVGDSPEIDPVVLTKITDLENDITEVNEKIEEVATKAEEPCDWNTMANKPFGEEVTKVEVVSEQEVTTESFPWSSSCYGAPFEDGNFEIIDGAKYTVVLNGEQYEATAKTVNGSCHIGNLGLVGSGLTGNHEEDTGENFCVFSMEGMVGISTTEAATYTVALYVEQETVKPLDEKYLPERLQFGEEILEIAYEGTHTFVDGESLTVYFSEIRKRYYADQINYDMYVGFGGVEYDLKHG